MLKRFGSIFCLLHSSNCSEKTAPVTRLFFPSSLFHAFITVIWSTFKIHTESEHLTPVCTCVYQSLSHAWLLVACTLWPTRLLCPWDSRQEYRSGLPFPSPGDFPDPGIEPRCPVLQADSLPSEPPGKPIYFHPVQKLTISCQSFRKSFQHISAFTFAFRPPPSPPSSPTIFSAQ